MINESEQARLSDLAESKTEAVLRDLGCTVTRLDRRKGQPRPDYLAALGDSKFICEVKCVFSGGYLRDRNAHCSSIDSAFLGSGLYHHEIDLRSIDGKLQEAVRQYRALTRDAPEFSGLPLLVVFYFDVFASQFQFYPAKMESFPLVSGIAKLVDDYKLMAALRTLSSDELLRRVEEGDMSGLPGARADLLLVANECASVSMPRIFSEVCIVDKPQAI